MNQQASKDANETTTTSKPPYMQNRELSWLDFNKRVLDQGADPTVPLLERLNFISIFWSNLQEFFMVRVGSLTDLALLKKSIVDPKSGMTPAEQLDAVYARCHELYPYYEETFENLRGLLAQENICQLRKDDLTDEQLVALDDYMADNVLPFLSPQIVNARPVATARQGDFAPGFPISFPKRLNHAVRIKAETLGPLLGGLPDCHSFSQHFNHPLLHKFCSALSVPNPPRQAP